jgi:hypothetical protein
MDFLQNKKGQTGRAGVQTHFKAYVDLLERHV